MVLPPSSSQHIHMDDDAVQRTEGATEEDSGIWLCSRTQGHWAVMLNRMAESTSWRTSLLFMNGVWTSKNTKIHDLDCSFMVCEVNPTFALSCIKLI